MAARKNLYQIIDMLTDALRPFAREKLSWEPIVTNTFGPATQLRKEAEEIENRDRAIQDARNALAEIPGLQSKEG